MFEAKQVVLKNLVLSWTTSFGFLAPCQNLEKINDPTPRKYPERRKDRQTLFAGPAELLPLAQ